MPASSTIDRAQRNVALLVAGCFFMEMLDGTIVTTSAPKIARALHVPVGSIALVITAYLLTLAVLIPLSGWIAARFGGRATFLVAIVLFTLASVGCAASTSLPELVGMRVLQATGGAMMVPVGRLLVLSRADASNLMRLTALLVWPGLIAPVFAPLASRLGFRGVLIGSTAALAVSFILLGVAGTSTPVVVLALILLLNGAGRSIGATGYSTVIFGDVPPAEMRHANTLLLTTQQLSASWGVALGAIALRIGDPVAGLFGGAADTHTAYTVAFILVACLALLATAEALRMHPSSGDSLRGDHAPAAEPQPAAR